MSPPSVVASPSSATKAAGDAQADYPSDDIRQSIAALRSVLMLDTPSRNILNRRLSSPPQTCQPQLRNAVQSPEQSSPGLSLQDRLDDEIQRRRELESAHESLLKLQKQQSNQLELMTEARKDLENRVTKLQSEINVEGGARSQERVQWLRKIEAARQGNKMLQPSKLDESRSQQRLDQSKFVHARDLEALREELQSKQTEHELERKEWQSRMAELNGRLSEVRAAADTAENARLSAQEKLTRGKMELASSNAKLDQVLNEKLELEKQMKEMSTVNADLEQQLEEMSHKLEEMTGQMNKVQNEREESKTEMQNLSSELSTIKRQLEDCHEIREERNILAERLRSSEEGRMSLTEQLQQAEAKLGSLSTQVKEKEILRTENESLKQSLRGLAEKAGEVNDLKKKLQASEGIIMNNDEMLRNMELELEEARTELSKCAVREIEQAGQLQETISAHEKLQSDYKRLKIAWNAKTDMAKKDETLETTPGKSAKFELEKESGISIVSDGTEKKLQEEVKRLQNEKTALTAQLRTVKTTHENHLIEVATNREKIRELEGLLEDSRNRAAELEAMVGKDSMIPEGPARSQRKRQRNENSH